MKRLLMTCSVLAVPAGAFALGIRLFDHDAFATARGDAFVATADNPSAIYYNPAGISQLQGHNARVSVYSVDVHSEFDPASGGRQIETEDEFIPLPGMFYTYTAEKLPLSFGAGYYLPYGLSLEWPGNAPFRKVTRKGELQYNTISGIVSYKVCPTLSIGAGPTFNFASTKLQRGIAAPGDRFAFRGDDKDWGAVAGILWQPAEKHSFGLSYRSETSMSFEGHSRITPYPVPLQHAETALSFPQVVIGGYSFRPTTNWNLEVDLDWTDWNVIHTPVLKQRTGNVPLPLNWDSSWAVEAGVTRYLEHGLHVSGGYVFIENSTPSATYDPLVPDQDLHVFSAGIGGQHSHLSWDLTYQFTWGPGKSVTSSVYGPSVSGDYSFVAHGISVSVGYHF